MAEEQSLKQQEFRIGLLVVAGFLAIVLLILLSDRINFDTYYRITAYMDNAAGLRTNSPVQLAGIKIGEIDSIQTSRSESAPAAVIAVLRINERYDLSKNAVLTIGSSGIFGDSYLSFSDRNVGESELLPKDGTGSVVATPGFIDEVSRKGEIIVNSIVDLLSDETRSDVKRLVREGADAAGEARVLIHTLNKSTKHISSTLANLDKTSAKIQEHTEKVGEQTQQVLANVNGGINDVRKQLSSISGEIQSIAERLESSLESVDKMSQTTNDIMTTGKQDIISALKNFSEMSSRLSAITKDLKAGKGPLGKVLRSETLAKDIDKITIDLQDLSQRIADHPEILIFGDSEEGRAKSRLERQRREQRRAFNEGYGSKLGTRRPGGERELSTTDEPAAAEVIEEAPESKD